jgi:hypothetical protein
VDEFIHHIDTFVADFDARAREHTLDLIVFLSAKSTVMLFLAHARALLRSG